MTPLDDYANALQERQKRRRALPAWFKAAHLVIFIAGLFGTLVVLFALVSATYAAVHPGHPFRTASSLAQKVMIFPLLPGALGPTFAIGNFLEWAITPMRETWKRHFQGVKGAGLADAMRTTYWLLGLTAICLAVSFVGAVTL